MRSVTFGHPDIEQRWTKPGSVGYLASPFSADSRAVRALRHMSCVEFWEKMQTLQIQVYSPIIYTYHLSLEIGGSVGFEDWAAFDYVMIDKCDHFAILKLSGWDASVGVNSETHYAINKDKPVSYVDLTYSEYRIHGGPNLDEETA